jgi:hypothetical protein
MVGNDLLILLDANGILYLCSASEVYLLSLQEEGRNQISKRTKSAPQKNVR